MLVPILPSMHMALIRLLDYQLRFLAHLEVCLIFQESFPCFTTHSLGLLATAILNMHGVGGLAGWRWIFILEGIATVLLSIISAFFLPAGIVSATFLTEEERSFACTAVLWS